MSAYLDTIQNCDPETSEPLIRHQHTTRYEFAAEQFAHIRPTSLLDVGSGRGYGDAMLLAVTEFIVGLDYDLESLRHAAGRYAGHRLHFMRGDAHSLPFADETFDAVVSIEVIEHVEHPEKMASEMARVLKPGGCLILSTPNRHFYGDPMTIRQHLRHYYPEEVFALLQPLFAEVRLWGQFIGARHVRWSQCPMNRAIVRVKHGLGLYRSILPRSFHAALSRRLFGVSPEDITPDDIHFSAENLAKSTHVVAISTK